MVLGSGFQHALSEMKIAVEIPYGQLPGFPSVGVSGHAGKMVLGHFDKTPVLILKGRSHFYEGHEMERVTFAVRAVAEFGIRALLLTNAAGGINKKFKAGDFMILNDHINFMGTNPLRGPGWAGLPRFVDLTNVYDDKLTELLKKAGNKSKLKMHAGVYLAVTGPSYETPAEIRAFGKLGADAVGMSTVPEAIVARQCGLRVAGVSCITNLGAGLSDASLSHQEVLAIAEQKKESLAQFLRNFSQLYAESK
ncbi:MAG: purine-nucleoside phosphorylase [Verrucomicrobiota bacterium]|nr:purine-nucleoside phosphorylase [Verrucomicrobiota bacterium]